MTGWIINAKVIKVVAEKKKKEKLHTNSNLTSRSALAANVTPTMSLSHL
jgi:hypothetical protein